jgi:hypothetical protein
MRAMAQAFDGMTLEASGANLHFALVMPEKTVEDLVQATAQQAQKRQRGCKSLRAS